MNRWLACTFILVTGCGDSDELPPESRSPPPPCADGELTLDDGSCLRPGVPPEGCAEGFVHDGDARCEPILPETICARGTMAVPGEAACRPVAPCVEGRWGAIPVEPATHYVDARYAALDSDGTQQRPWARLGDAIGAAQPNALIAVAAGRYQEDVDISNKPVRIWGVCPERVEIVGQGGELAAVTIRGGTSGTELHALAITGPKLGLANIGAADLHVEGVWIHDVGFRGVNVENAEGPTGISLRDTLVEHTRVVGIFAGSSEVSMERSVVRDTLPGSSDAHAIALEVVSDPFTGAPSTLTLRQSVLERNEARGILGVGSVVNVYGTVVRQAESSHTCCGDGVSVEPDPTSLAASTLDLRSSLIASTMSSGILAIGSIHIENVVVRDTLPQSDGRFGRGLTIQDSPYDLTQSSGTVRATVIERSREFGASIIRSRVTVERSLIDDTAPNDLTTYGDGICAVSDGSLADLTISSTRVVRSARAGLSCFGALVRMHQSELVCQAFDIDSETVQGQACTLEGPDTSCGCPAAMEDCKAVSPGLAPPEPL